MNKCNMAYSLVEVYQRSRGMCSLHLTSLMMVAAGFSKTFVLFYQTA